MGRGHGSLGGGRVRRYNHGSVRRLVRTGRHLHLLGIGRIPLRILGGIRRRRVAIHRKMVAHIGWRRPHVGRTGSVGKVLLPSRRYGRLPMGHCGQIMVHVHRLPGTLRSRLGSFSHALPLWEPCEPTKRRESGTRSGAPVYAAILPSRPEDASC